MVHHYHSDLNFPLFRASVGQVNVKTLFLFLWRQFWEIHFTMTINTWLWLDRKIPLPDRPSPHHRYDLTTRAELYIEHPDSLQLQLYLLSPGLADSVYWWDKKIIKVSTGLEVTGLTADIITTFFTSLETMSLHNSAKLVWRIKPGFLYRLNTVGVEKESSASSAFIVLLFVTLQPKSTSAITPFGYLRIVVIIQRTSCQHIFTASQCI